MSIPSSGTYTYPMAFQSFCKIIGTGNDNADGSSYHWTIWSGKSLTRATLCIVYRGEWHSGIADWILIGI